MLDVDREGKRFLRMLHVGKLGPEVNYCEMYVVLVCVLQAESTAMLAAL